MMKYLPWWSELVPQLLPFNSSFVLHSLGLSQTAQQSCVLLEVYTDCLTVESQVCMH